jgi:hypothetical protein
MPTIVKKTIIPFLTTIYLLISIVSTPATSLCNEGIKLYYVRYDVKTSRHQIVDTNLIMLPCENEFRAEKFSVIQTYGAISATYNESEDTLTKFAKENAIISLLRENGLHSVTSKDYDTVVSYEGVIKTPVIILEKGFENNSGAYYIKIQSDFSPIAFPDKWKNLKTKSQIKKFFSDFISLFK